MPPLETEDLHQYAVLWPTVEYDEFNDPVRGTPVEIRVRWEFRFDYKNQEEDNTTHAEVVVDRTIPLRSLMWLGRLEDFQGTGSGELDQEIKEVERYSETPDIDDRNRYRTVILRKYQDALPPLAQLGTASSANLVVIGTGFGFAEISTGTGTGTDDVSCHNCDHLNDNFVATLLTNDNNTQVWESTPAYICEEEWRWVVTRDLVNNEVTAELKNEVDEVQATYLLTNTSWNGEDTIVLVFQSGNVLCEWALTLALQAV